MSWQRTYSSIRRTLLVALLSIPAVLLFFLEYLPPFRKVHIPFDLPGYHYPLFNYAFLRLKAGDFPVWDPTTYAGMDFVANVQAALFYPPTWLMFLLSWRADSLPYFCVELLDIAHVWLAFVTAWLWLSNKKLDVLPAIIGAMVFAIGGYACMQLQHFGQVAAYAWFPFGLWGIDQACARNSWAPLWKLALAVGMTFLAGYPPTWLVYVVAVAAYILASTRNRRILGAAIAAGALSIALIAVQLLPVWEASLYRKTEFSYGSKRDPMAFISWIIANFWDFDMDVPVMTNPDRQYFYLGALALVGLLCLLRFRDRQQRVLPALAIVGAGLFVITDAGNMVSWIVERSATLGDLVRSYYFMASITLGLSMLCAQGLHACLQVKAKPLPPWMTWLAVAGLIAWPVSGVVRWTQQNFAAGWLGAIDSVALITIMGFSLYVYRVASGNPRRFLFAALLVATAIEFKVFGTSKRISADVGPGPAFSSTAIRGMNSDDYRTLRSQPEFRVLLDEWGPQPAELRHMALSTPNGFDPFLGSRYEELITSLGTFRTNREFSISPQNDKALHLLGVRYVITAEQSPIYADMKADTDFQLITQDNSYYKVFEYREATPSYGWENSADTAVQLETWQPERRSFRVNSPSGGLFTLSEQYLPGWAAFVDGTEQAVKPWQIAFQSVAVAPGEHTVEFRYRSRLLLPGVIVSLLALLLLGWWIRADIRAIQPRDA